MVGEDSPISVALQAAAELKSTAAELGDMDSATRRQRFSDILQQAEKKLSPQQHIEFYTSLERWFPGSAPAGSAGLGEGAPAVSLGMADLSAATGPDALIEALDPILHSFSEEEKAALAKRLKKRIPLPSSKESRSLFLAPETVRRLELQPEDPSIKVARLAPLLGLLIEFLVDLDATAWDVWELIRSEGVPLKREVDMKATIRAMLTGRVQLTMPQIVFQIGQLKRLIVEMLPHLTKVGTYAGKHFKTVSPKQLENADAVEPHAWMAGNQAARCWRLYSERYPQMEKSAQRAMSEDIGKSVADAVNVKRY